VRKLRRKQIAGYEAANQYLEQEYLPQHNRRFAQAAAEEEDCQGRKPSRNELQRIFRLETQRRIGNDWVVRHQGRFLQLHPKHGHYGPTQAKALVCEWEDGTTEVYYRGESIAFQELAPPPPSQPRGRQRPRHGRGFHVRKRAQAEPGSSLAPSLQPHEAEWAGESRDASAHGSFAVNTRRRPTPGPKRRRL